MTTIDDQTTERDSDTPAIRLLRESLFQQGEKLKALHIDLDPTIDEGKKAEAQIEAQSAHVAGLAEAITELERMVRP